MHLDPVRDLFSALVSSLPSKLNEALLKHEYTSGNGQCHVCGGHDPGVGWWTENVGHLLGCSYANFMLIKGLNPFYEMKNPERVVGYYVPTVSGFGIHAGIRANDKNKDIKLRLSKELNREKRSELLKELGDLK